MNKFWKNLSSIRWRLTLWFTFALALSLVIFSVTVYFAMRQALITQLETSLQDGTLALAENLRHEFEEGDSLSVATGSVIRDSSLRNLEIEIYGPNGNLIANSDDINQPTLIAGLEINKLPVLGEGIARSEIKSSSIDPTGLKIAAVRVIHSITDESYSIVVGARRSIVAQELQTLKRLLFTFAPLLLLLAAAGGFYLARRAMKPVSEMAAQAREMNANRLSERLSIANPNDELGQLGSTFNELFDRIETAFAQMRQFIADASHELRTPVTVIRTETDVALTPPRDTDEAFRSLEIIQDESIRLSRLVEDMFTLARADADDYNTLKSERIPLGELIETCARSAETLGRSRNVSVELNNRISSLVTVKGDRIRIAQMILNILDNATKYTQSDGKVKISAQVASGIVPPQAVIEIQDNGPGIPDEFKKSVFDRFYRIDKARTRSISGSGLGLPIARSIAEAHRSEIILSDSKSGGAHFTIMIPIIET